MYVLKGFMVIQQLVNNIAGNVSLLGELSPSSSTFSKEIAYYEVPEISGFKLNVFSNKNANFQEVFTDVSIGQECVRVVKSTFDYFRIHAGLVDLEDLRESVLSLNPGTSNITFGELIKTPIVTLPEWISWKSTFKGGYSIKIWLSDNAFRSQYDEYSITVIPPLENISDFLEPPSVVKSKLDSKKVTDYLDLIQAARKERPETILRSFNAKYVAPLTPELSIDTSWTLLIYGNAGDNIDTIKQALIDHILERTTTNESIWKNLFPEIFKTNQLIFVPLWDKIAISDLSNMSSIYSSIVNPEEVKNTVIQKVYSVSENALLNTRIVPIPYRSLLTAVVPGNDNESVFGNFTQLYPDYIPVSSTSLDFNRMSKKTIDFLLLLERMIILAENLTEFSSVPSEFRKIKKNGRIYVSFFDGFVNYLVLSRISYTG